MKLLFHGENGFALVREIEITEYFKCVVAVLIYEGSDLTMGVMTLSK